MGVTVYDVSDVQGHVYCHSRRDGEAGCVYLIVNNSLTDGLAVELPYAAQRYTLHADTPRATVMRLGGRPLTLDENGALPELAPEAQQAGLCTLPPCSWTFLVC